MRLLLPVLLSFLCAFAQISYAQELSSSLIKNVIFPTQIIEKLQKKSARLEKNLVEKTEKYLRDLAKKERKIYFKLKNIDSVKAAVFIDESQRKYDALLKQIKEPSQISGLTTSEYLPYVDSLNVMLSFINEHPQFLNASSDLQQKISSSLQQFRSLHERLKQSDAIKQFIRERKEHLKTTLGTYTRFPSGLTKELEGFNKQFYYYSQQIREYQQILNEPNKLTLRALALLNKLPAFTKFIQNHSQLAGLFSIPATYSVSQGINGLQTIDQVRQLVLNQVGSGPNAMATLQQNLQAAQSQLGQLKAKINQLGGGTGDIDMPNYRPNNEKVKTFWKRLEYGTNVQSTRSNYYFPTSTEFGLSVGYKLSGFSILGVGLSYRIGWGKDIQHIVITHEGIGLRSFFDTKVRGSFFASAGFEYNYQQPFSSVSQWQRFRSWQQSGLAGVSKIISLKSKVFKKTKVQLLWDFLSYSQRPVTQPLKFRIGYNF